MKNGLPLLRHPTNPILTAADWPYPAHSVFNPGATRLADGTTLLLCRVEDHRGHSHLCVARSKDGIGDWVIDREPTLLADPSNYPEERWGIEDPRITFVAELGKYIVAYTAFGEMGPGVALASTTDFRGFERLGLVLTPHDKDAAVLPRRIDGRFALVHRPVRADGSDIWMSFSDDLRTWDGATRVLAAREVGYWDSAKIGLSPPLVQTPRGWLMLYHGVRETCSGSLYRVGAALLELERPWITIARGEPWLFGPDADYERVGDVPNVTFPCGFTVGDDGDTIHVYYGAADTSIALATGSVSGILDWLDRSAPPR